MAIGGTEAGGGAGGAAGGRRSVLVTGGAGFIGTHTVLRLLEQGYGVTVVDNFHNSVPEALDRVRLIAGPALSARLDFIRGDLRSTEDLEKVFAARSASISTSTQRQSHTTHALLSSISRYERICFSDVSETIAVMDEPEPDPDPLLPPPVHSSSLPRSAPAIAPSLKPTPDPESPWQYLQPVGSQAEGHRPSCEIEATPSSGHGSCKSPAPAMGAASPCSHAGAALPAPDRRHSLPPHLVDLLPTSTPTPPPGPPASELQPPGMDAAACVHATVGAAGGSAEREGCGLEVGHGDQRSPPKPGTLSVLLPSCGSTSTSAAVAGEDEDVGAPGLDAFLVNPSAPAASPSSALNPHAAPFLPGGCTEGRSKASRWADDDLFDDSVAKRMPAATPYLDAVLREPRPSQASTISLPHSRTLSGHVGTVAGRQDAGRRRGRRNRSRPQLVHGIPARPAEGRIPARQRLGRRGQVSAPNAEGWRDILHRQEMRTAAVSIAPRESATGVPPVCHRSPRRIPAALFGKCLNCLSSTHRVATCRLPQRCLRCKGLRHVARDCKQSRRAGVWGSSGARASSRSAGPEPQVASTLGSGAGGLAAPGKAVPDVDGPCNKGRRQRRRRRRPRRRHGGSDGAEATASKGFTADGQAGRALVIVELEVDPLVLALRVDATFDRDPAGDPMLLELTSSSSLSCSRAARRSTPKARPVEDAPLLGVGASAQAAPQAPQQASPSRPASPPPCRSISPRRLAFDDSDVDAAADGEGDWPPGFGPLQVETSTENDGPAGGAQDAQGAALRTPPRSAGHCTPPSPADSASAQRRLKNFIDKVKKPRPPPLLPTPALEDTTYGRFTSPCFPSRSKRIAAQSISHIPTSKRGEYLILKRMGQISGTQPPSASAVQAFEEMISSDSNEEALQLLFPPDSDVGPRKRRGRRRATRA